MEAATCKGFRFLSVASDCKTKTYVRNSGEDERWKVTSSQNEVEVKLFKVYGENINSGILGALAKLWKATIIFVMSLSVRLPAWNMWAPTRQIFTKFGINFFCWKSVEKIQVSLKSNKINGYCTRRPMCIYDYISLNTSSNEKFWQTKFVEKMKTQISCSLFFFSKILPFMR